MFWICFWLLGGRAHAADSALAAYRSRHLEVRTIRTFESLAAPHHHPHYWQYGPWRLERPHWHPAWGATRVVHGVISTEHWHVYQGSFRLSVPTYLSLVGDMETYANVDRKIRSNRRMATGFEVVTAIAATSIVAGLAGQSLDRPEEVWPVLTLAGLGGVVVGIVGSGTASSTAERWMHDYSRLDPAIVRSQVNEFNDALRVELELSREQGWRALESQPGWEPPPK